VGRRAHGDDIGHDEHVFTLAALVRRGAVVVVRGRVTVQERLVRITPMMRVVHHPNAVRRMQMHVGRHRPAREHGQGKNTWPEGVLHHT
jgi:hypothetical protein